MEIHFCQTAEEFENYIQSCLEKKEFVRIQFYNEINAFFTEHTLLKNWDIETKEVSLMNDTIIPLKKIVRINEFAAVGYNQEYFHCDC